jgi:hypothetical protein
LYNLLSAEPLLRKVWGGSVRLYDDGGVSLVAIIEVCYQKKDKTRELEAEPSSVSGTFLGILDPEILTF